MARRRQPTGQRENAWPTRAREEGLRVAGLSREVMAWTSWAGWPRASLHLADRGPRRTSQAAILCRLAALGLPLVEVCLAAPSPSAAEAALLSRVCDLGLTTVCRLGGLPDLGRVDRRVVRVVDLVAAEDAPYRLAPPAGWDQLTPGDEVRLRVGSLRAYRWARALLSIHPAPTGAVIWLCARRGAAREDAEIARALADCLPVRLLGAGD